MTLILAVELTANASGLTGQVRLSKEELQRFGVEVQQAGQRASQAGRGIGGMGDRSAVAARQTARLRRETTSLRSGLNSLRAAAAAVGLGLLIRQTGQAGIEMEGLENTLLAVTGSSHAAAAEFAFVSEESERLGLNLVATARSYAQLAAAAKGTSLEGQASRDIFLAISEASTVLQLDARRTELALFAVQQIISKGRVSSEELRRQLGDLLPGAFQIAARSMAVTTAELDKMIESGDLLAEDFLPRFAAEIRKSFGGAVVEASQSARAEFNRLSNAIFALEADVADSGFLSGLARGAADLVEALGDPAVIGTLTTIGELLGDTASLAAQNLDILTALAVGYGVARAAALAFAVAQGAVNVALAASPIGAVIAAIGIAAGAYVLFADSTEAVVTASGRYEDALRQANEVSETAADLSKRLTEERRQEAKETAQLALTEQFLIRVRALQAIDETRARIDRLETNARGRDVNETVARLNSNIERLETTALNSGQAIIELQNTITELNKLPTTSSTTPGLDPLVISSTETELQKLLDTMKRARDEAALEFDIVGLSARDQAIARAQFEALAAAQEDFNEGVRESALLLPQEQMAIADVAGAAFDFANALDDIEAGQKRARSTADAFGKAAGGALVDLRNKAFDATEAVNRLIDSLFQALIIDPFSQAISNFAFDLLDPTGAAAGGAAGGGGGSSIPAEIQHQGGLVGTGPTRAVDSAVFAGAPRMHRGGLVPGERPIVALAGEEVLTERDPRHRRNLAGGAGSDRVTIIDQRGANAPDIGVQEREGAGGLREIELFVTDAVAKNIAKRGSVSKAIEGRFDVRPQGVR